MDEYNSLWRTNPEQYARQEQNYDAIYRPHMLNETGARPYNQWKDPWQGREGEFDYMYRNMDTRQRAAFESAGTDYDPILRQWGHYNPNGAGPGKRLWISATPQPGFSEGKSLWEAMRGY